MTLRSSWAYLAGLAPVIIVWVVLVGWLASLLAERGEWPRNSDEAAIHEWLDQSRIFRSTLPALGQEYAALVERSADAATLKLKRGEIHDHIRALVEPIRAYDGELPTFPVIYSIRLSFTDIDAEPIVWESPLPRPREQGATNIRTLRYDASAEGQPGSVTIECQYRLHAYSKLQQQASDRQRASLVAWAVLIAATALATLFVVRFLRKERQREQQEMRIQAENEQRQRELLEIRIRQQEAEHARDEAERAALEMSSQLYASIGIMAGSYAHNIKNLLVRPNDLLNRCIEVNGLNAEQTGMLGEVKTTLGTVTERLQEILHTVRRDPNQKEMAQLDLVELIRDSLATWHQMSQQKWKIQLSATLPEEPVWIQGDSSHLQQAVENLIFNARDATFEMRSHLRESARSDSTLSADDRRQRLIEAASWRGNVELSVTAHPPRLVVADNGIGMTPEVRDNCMATHFSTKRDNAIFEGYNAGMGLGLSFVAVVLGHHNATSTIETEPWKGTRFIITFPET